MNQFETERAGVKQEVAKDLINKTVKVGGTRIGFCSGAEWQWCEAAGQRYTNEQLEMAKAFAEQS